MYSITYIQTFLQPKSNQLFQIKIQIKEKKNLKPDLEPSVTHSNSDHEHLISLSNTQTQIINT